MGTVPWRPSVPSSAPYGMVTISQNEWNQSVWFNKIMSQYQAFAGSQIHWTELWCSLINFQNECFCNSLSHGKRKVLELRAFAKCFLYLLEPISVHIYYPTVIVGLLSVLLLEVSVRITVAMRTYQRHVCQGLGNMLREGAAPRLTYLTLLCKQSLGMESMW